MIIKKVKLKNYRQFKNLEISFDKKERSNDLHVIIGRNGTGKTNFLNAINWCLYDGDEPHLSKDSQQLPLLNLKNIQNDGKDKEVIVEIWVETNEKKSLVFTRRGIYRIYNSNTHPSLQKTEFEARITDEKGNTKILSDKEATPYVDRFVPKRIREFFFFDGERLDTYFREATGQNIRHATFDISQIDLLDIIEDRLDKISKDLRKNAGKINPLIEETEKKLEQKEADLDEKIKRKDECKKQAEKAKTKIKEYEEKMRAVPDVEVLEKEREKLKENKAEKQNRINEKLIEKQNLLFESGIIIILYPIIKNAISIIEEKKKRKEIPPTINKALLENIIREGNCSICGRPLDEESVKHASKLLKEIKISSEVAQQLLDMENPLFRHKERYKNFKAHNKKLIQEIEIYEKELSNIEQRINQIDKELSGYDVTKIKEWHEQRKKFEEIYDQKQKELGVLKEAIDTLKNEIEYLKKKLDEEISKEKKANDLKKQMDFSLKALDIIIKTKKQIMSETREKIEVETKKLFFDLTWKKTTFQDVKIDESYNINLIHSMGYECLGSVSAAERELLMLSFTLALHKISGFDSPLLIDTPVARVSDVHRENFGKIFSEVSKNKQIILLFTPAEYSEEISKIVDNTACNRYLLKLSSDEKEANVEVL